jgi:hypothetical protein
MLKIVWNFRDFSGTGISSYHVNISTNDVYFPMKLSIYVSQSVHKSKISSDVIRNIWEPMQQAYITNTIKMEKARHI